jgi:hypothetical protein
MADTQNASAKPVDAGAKEKKLSLKKNVSMESFGGPRKAFSAFFLFSNEVRPGVTEKIRADLGPDGKFNVSMVAKKIGEMWKDASEEKKGTLKKKADELKAKYDADLEKFKLSDGYKKFLKASALHNKKKNDKKALQDAKASGMPVRPMAGYMMFGNEIRDTIKQELTAKNEPYSVTVVAGLTKTKWDALGEEGQKPYHDKYQVAKQEFAEELLAWQASAAGKLYEKTKATNAKRKQKASKLPKAKRVKKDADAGEDGDESEEDDDISLSSSGEGDEVQGEEEE